MINNTAGLLDQWLILQDSLQKDAAEMAGCGLEKWNVIAWYLTEHPDLPEAECMMLQINILYLSVRNAESLLHITIACIFIVVARVITELTLLMWKFLMHVSCYFKNLRL